MRTRWHYTRRIGRTALRSMDKNRLRSFLSVVGVTCGVVAVLLMLAVGEGARRESLRQVARLGTTNVYVRALPQTRLQQETARRGLSRGVTRYDLRRLRAAIPQALHVTGLRELKIAGIGTGRMLPPLTVACLPDLAAALGLVVPRGRFIGPRDLEENNLVCVLGGDLSRDLGASGRPGALLRVDHLQLRVVGVLERIAVDERETAAVPVRDYNRVLFVPLSAARALAATETADERMTADGLSEIVVRMRVPEAVPAAAEIVQRTMATAHREVEDYQVIVPLELLAQARKTRQVFTVVLGTIAAVALLVGGIGVMNVMLASVSERIREIGVRRAVGATRGDILYQFLSESVMLTLSGGIFGVLIGIAGTAGVVHWAGWQAAVTWRTILIPLGASLLVGLFFGIHPARRAAGMDPIAALRYDG